MPLIYLILIVSLLLFYILYKGAFSFYLFGFVIILPIVLFGVYFYVSRKLKINLIKSGSIKIKEQKIPLNIEIINPTFIPVTNMTLSIEVSDSISGKKDIFKINTPVYPKENQCLSIDIKPAHCGKICCKIVKCRLTDLLKLFIFKVKKSSAEPDNYINFCVIPEYNLPNFPVLSNFYNDISDEQYSKKNKGDDPSEIFDIHEYNAGDKINKIHWKLSAKQDITMVKEYSLPLTNSIMIFFNPCIEFTDENSDEMSEKYDTIMESVISVCAYLSKNSISYSAFWLSNGLLQNRTITNTAECKQLFRSFAFADTCLTNKTLESLFRLEEYGFNKYQYSNLMYFSCKYDETALKYLFNSEIALKYSFFLTDNNKNDNFQNEYLDYGKIYTLEYGRNSNVSQIISELSL